MKNILLFLFTIIFLSNCQNYKPIKGNNIIGESVRTVPSFERVISEISGDVVINCTEGSAYSCVVKCETNIAPIILTDVAQNELVITYKDNANISTNQKIEINITCPTLISAKLLGSGNIDLKGHLLSKKFDCNQMGSGNINLENAAIENLRINLSGSGNINFKNSTAINSEYALKGSGNIDAQTSPTKFCKIKLEGSGVISSFVLDSLDAELNGSGIINYKGTPKAINKVNNGSGQIVNNE
jgi:Putative auto-transporter adhesin, head GIN domain